MGFTTPRVWVRVMGVKLEEFLPLPAFSGGRLSWCGGDGCKADAVYSVFIFALFLCVFSLLRRVYSFASL